MYTPTNFYLNAKAVNVGFMQNSVNLLLKVYVLDMNKISRTFCEYHSAIVQNFVSVWEYGFLPQKKNGIFVVE